MKCCRHDGVIFRPFFMHCPCAFSPFGRHHSSAVCRLTTTGYTYVFPMTAIGQCFAVVYGLIGIPLMVQFFVQTMSVPRTKPRILSPATISVLQVLTAVDIGRFLSDVVLWVYSKVTNRVRKMNLSQCF